MTRAKLSYDDLRILVRSNVSLAEIRAKLGREIRPAEQTIINQARLDWKLSRAKKKIKGPRSKLLQKRLDRIKDRTITLRKLTKAQKKKRAELEQDCQAWLRFFMPAAFYAPFGDGHLAIINETIHAVESGVGVAVAGPRGEGKSTILRGIVLFLVATRKVRFPVIAGWTHKSAGESFRMWVQMLHSSIEFRTYYPELTMPFEESVHTARIKNFIWAHNKIECGAEVRASDKVVVLPSSLGALAAGSVQGDVKGLSVVLQDGTVLRPDLLLIDDAQDPKRASDPSFVASIVETIEKQWMCLAGPHSRITTMVACTVAAVNDVSEHFLSRPDFRSIRVSRVVSWPEGWKDKESLARKLWDEWHEVLLDGLQLGDAGAAGRGFYRAHQAEMIKGMKVSWAHRMDIKRKDPDAFYSAMFDYYHVGEAAFLSEYQNQPLRQGTSVHILSPEIIQSRVTDRAAGSVPTWVRLRVAATDINPSYGLTWSLLGFGSDQTSAVILYGIHPMSIAASATNAQWEQDVFAKLESMGKALASLTCPPELWVVDGSGEAFNVVLRFAQVSAKLCGLQVLPCTGRGARNYRPYGKSVLGLPREQCHLACNTVGQKWLAYNSDYWREQAQKAWTGSVGSPGSCSLPDGFHRDFADQICREQLIGKGKIAEAMHWVWNTLPGPHDYGDCMTMCYAAAAWGGIGTGGASSRPKAPKRFKPQITMVRS